MEKHDEYKPKRPLLIFTETEGTKKIIYRSLVQEERFGLKL